MHRSSSENSPKSSKQNVSGFDVTLSLEYALLWIMDLYFGKQWWFEVKMSQWFLTNTQLFTSHDKMLTDVVVWINLMILSAVWTLVLTAPIHCRASLLSKWCNAEFLRWRNKLIYIWMVSGCAHFHFWVKYVFHNHFSFIVNMKSFVLLFLTSLVAYKVSKHRFTPPVFVQVSRSDP